MDLFDVAAADFYGVGSDFLHGFVAVKRRVEHRDVSVFEGFDTFSCGWDMACEDETTKEFTMGFLVVDGRLDDVCACARGNNELRGLDPLFVGFKIGGDKAGVSKMT